MTGAGTDPGDEGLGGLFDELKAGEGRTAPPFETMLAAAHARAARRRARRPLRLAAAAAVAAAALAAVVVVRPWKPKIAPVAIAAWESPTAFLLATPGDAVLRGVPPVTASLVNLDAGAAAPLPATVE